MRPHLMSEAALRRLARRLVLRKNLSAGSERVPWMVQSFCVTTMSHGQSEELEAMSEEMNGWMRRSGGSFAGFLADRQNHHMQVLFSGEFRDPIGIGVDEAQEILVRCVDTKDSGPARLFLGAHELNQRKALSQSAQKFITNLANPSLSLTLRHCRISFSTKVTNKVTLFTTSRARRKFTA